jgi:hypothetical protein
MNERKNSVISLKSNLGGSKKVIEKGTEFLTGMSILNLILTIISAGFSVLSILAEIFGYEIFKWQNRHLWLF